MNSNDWVAEHVMGFERGNCRGTMGGGSTGSDGTFETWFRCDWCGRHICDGKTPRLHRWGDGHRVGEPTLIEARESGPCAQYPFPKFTLVDLMRKLGEKGDYVMIRCDAQRLEHNFTLTLRGHRVADTDDPLQSLCDYVYQNRLYPQAVRHYHRQPEGKPNALALRVKRLEMLALKVNRLEERFEALLKELPPEIMGFRTI